MTFLPFSTLLMSLAVVLVWTPQPLQAFSLTTSLKSAPTTATSPSLSTRLWYSNDSMEMSPSVASSTTKPALVVQPTSHPSVQRITSLEELEQHLATTAASGTTTTTVVRFFSTTCRACKAGTPAFYRLVSDYDHDDDQNRVAFLDVAASAETKPMFQQLQVTRMPYGHVYASSGTLVHEGSMTRPKMVAFERALQGHVHRQGSADDHQTVSSSSSSLGTTTTAYPLRPAMAL